MIARARRILPGSLARIIACFTLAVAPAIAASAAHAMPLIGFTENWIGTSLDGWDGGSDLSNPGSGGIGGPGDGFLLISTPFPTHLGARSMGGEYQGDWLASGVNKVVLWLNDVNGADALEIHFALGNSTNFWEYNVGFKPPHNAWQQYSVDLSSEANFTRIIGQGTFAAALQHVDRIHLRHDVAPYLQSPDPIQGDFGLDGLTLTNDAVPVGALSWGRLKSIYR
jgi:hypothetical protein